MAAHKVFQLAVDVNIKELLSTSSCMHLGFIMNKVDLIETNMLELTSLMSKQVCAFVAQCKPTRRNLSKKKPWPEILNINSAPYPFGLKSSSFSLRFS